MVLAEAAPAAGARVVVSFVLDGVAALSYPELTGSVPVSGSAYSYTYTTLGELVAGISGWCLPLETGCRSTFLSPPARRSGGGWQEGSLPFTPATGRAPGSGGTYGGHSRITR